MYGGGKSAQCFETGLSFLESPLAFGLFLEFQDLQLPFSSFALKQGQQLRADSKKVIRDSEAKFGPPFLAFFPTTLRTILQGVGGDRAAKGYGQQRKE